MDDVQNLEPPLEDEPPVLLRWIQQHPKKLALSILGLLLIVVCITIWENAPKSPSDFMRRAGEHYNAGRYDKAVKDATRALDKIENESSPKDQVPNFRMFRAAAYSQMGEHDKAVEDLDAIIVSLNDEVLIAIFGSDGSFIDTQYFSIRLHDISGSTTTDSLTSARLFRASELIASGRHEEAAKELDALEDEHPDNSVLLETIDSMQEEMERN